MKPRYMNGYRELQREAMLPQELTFCQHLCYLF